jgi:hypothetical protein
MSREEVILEPRRLMPEFQELAALGAPDHRGVELRNAGHRLVPVRHRSPEHFPQIAIDAQDHCQKTSKKVVETSKNVSSAR